MKNLLVNLFIVSLFSIFTLGCDDDPGVTSDPSYSISNFSYTVDSNIEIGTAMGSLFSLGPRVTNELGTSINESEINSAQLEISISGDGSEFFDIAFKYNDDLLTGVYGELTLKEALTDMEGEVLSFEVLLNYRVVIDNKAVDKTDTATVTIVVFNKDQQPEAKPDLTPASDSGRSDEDDITSIVRPVFNIPCDIGMDIKLYFNDIYRTHNVCDNNPRSMHFSEDLAEGSYAVTYTLSVAAIEGGDETPQSPPLDVVIDTTIPVITLNGDAEMELVKGSEFTDPRAVITDSDVETDNSFLVITGDLDVNTVNTYTLRYNTKDTAGNSAVEVTRTISVVAAGVNNDSATPSSAPDLQAGSDSGSSNEDDYTNAMSQTFNLACPKANDVEVTARLYIGDVSVSNGVCTDTSFSLTAEGSALIPGSYDVSYTLQSAGQASETAKSPVLSVTLDSTAPVITLNGSNPLDLVKGTAYTEEATVNEGTLSIAGSVDIDVIDEYTLTYNAQDQAGNNTTEVTRTVNVIAAAIEPTAESPIAWFDDAGEELWKTNGTVAGTQRIADIKAGANSSALSSFYSDYHKMGDFYYFTAEDASGEEIWKTDLTTTTKVTTLVGANIYDLTVMGDYLYFANRTDKKLWRTNGTMTGQQEVAHIGAYGSGYMTTINGKLIFGVAEHVANQREPWVSDGDLPANGGTTELLKEIRAGDEGSDFTYLTMLNFNNRLYSSADDGSGRTLWVTDGTTENTVEFSTEKNPSWLTSAGADSFYFIAHDGGSQSLWKSTGVGGTTTKVTDLDDTVSNLTYVNGTLYFLVDDGKELWKSNGFAGGTQRVQDYFTETGGTLSDLVNLNDGLYFMAYKDFGYENGLVPVLSTSNGTTITTVKKLHNNNYYLYGPNPVRVVNGLIYLVIFNQGGTGKTELWRSDGQSGAEHTFMLKEGQNMGEEG